MLKNMVLRSLLKWVLAMRYNTLIMSNEFLSYKAFGAVGDGKTDDLDAIIRTHEAANKTGVGVCAEPNAVYYIGVPNKTAIIQTPTDWNTAKFIIDDSKITAENRLDHVFSVESKQKPLEITDIKAIRKGQDKLDIQLPFDAFVLALDNTTKRYIREGLNQDSGTEQTDSFILFKDGQIDTNTRPDWNFENITSLYAYPIDPDVLTINGGVFTTIANQAESKYNYYARGISIRRSNVVVDGMYHDITGEGDHGAPYHGFIYITECANITVSNCRLSGRKTYTTIGSAGLDVRMGSYDISINKAVNLLFKDCEQINSIHDTNIWGIFTSNFTKNTTLENVKFSRYDAHRGVTNVKINNSVLGHMGIKLIGQGVCTVENSKVYSNCFIELRGDYGSTWEGEIIIRNCEFIPDNPLKDGIVIVSSNNPGRHDFGYVCHAPKVTVEGMVIGNVQG